MNKIRVCVIGAGPSGMSTLCQFAKIAEKGEQIPEIVCYEKQSNWGGLWNFNWRIGTDEHGEYVHNSMYHKLWSNGPKEANEYPDYLFEDHFGKPIPSYPPREIYWQYFNGRWTKHNVRDWIHFNTVVRNVYFENNKFHVQVKQLSTNQYSDYETFDYVINASGHYSIPCLPEIKGMNNFSGRVMHSHDLRNMGQLECNNMLLIGRSYSAQDLATQSIKFKTVKKSITYSYRNSEIPYNMSDAVTKKPEITSIKDDVVTFKDGTTGSYDLIVFCTGYQHHYPYMSNSLKLESLNTFWPLNLYKGMIWTQDGNGKLFYIGAHDQGYSMTFFEIQAVWATQYIMGKLSYPTDQSAINNYIHERHQELLKLKSFSDIVAFQTKYMKELTEDTNYPYNLDASVAFNEWDNAKLENILTFRDKTHKNVFHGKMAPVSSQKFMDSFDDSAEWYMNHIVDH